MRDSERDDAVSARGSDDEPSMDAHMMGRRPAGKRVQIDDDRMVSFDERHLTVMRLTVTLLDSDAPVAIAMWSKP